MNTMQPYRYTWKQLTYTDTGAAWIEHCVPYDPRLEEYKELHQDVSDWADDRQIRCFMPLYVNPADWIEDSKAMCSQHSTNMLDSSHTIIIQQSQATFRKVIHGLRLDIILGCIQPRLRRPTTDYP